jgi:hypothetical protein
VVRRIRRLLAERSRRGRIASWALAAVALMGVVVALFLLFPRRDDPSVHVGLAVADPTIAFAEPLVVWPGLPVRVTGTRLTRGGAVAISVDDRRLATATAAPDGSLAAMLPLPADVAPGPATLRVRDLGSGRTLSADLDVRPPDVAGIAVQPDHSEPGGAVAVAGGGLPPAAVVRLRLGGDAGGAELRSGPTTADGVLLLTVVLPPDLEPGGYPILAEGADGAPLAPPATLEVRP